MKPIELGINFNIFNFPYPIISFVTKFKLPNIIIAVAPIGFFISPAQDRGILPSIKRHHLNRLKDS